MAPGNFAVITIASICIWKKYVLIGTGDDGVSRERQHDVVDMRSMLRGLFCVKIVPIIRDKG